jgi:hypothetical protein
MTYTVCITIPKDYYTITCVSEDDVKFIAAAFEAGHESFFLSGKKYDMKAISDFQVFSYDQPDDYHTKINGSQEALKEGIFKDGFVFFPPHALSKLFTNVTNDFIRRYSVNNSADKSGTAAFINVNRIDVLRSKTNSSFDLRRLIRMCEEINQTFSDRCFLSTIFLVRSLLDHVPPIFGRKSFAEIANNHGGKSFKEAMLHLENSSRKIADLYLHTQIKSNEILPEPQQVNFSQALDLLLAEVITHI